MVRCGKPTGYLRYGGVPRPREGNTVGNVNKVGCVFIFLFSYSFSLFLCFSFGKKERNPASTRYLRYGGVPRPREGDMVRCGNPLDTSVTEAYHVPVRVTQWVTLTK